MAIYDVGRHRLLDHHHFKHDVFELTREIVGADVRDFEPGPFARIWERILIQAKRRRTHHLIPTTLYGPVRMRGVSVSRRSDGLVDMVLRDIDHQRQTPDNTVDPDRDCDILVDILGHKPLPLYGTHREWCADRLAHHLERGEMRDALRHQVNRAIFQRKHGCIEWAGAFARIYPVGPGMALVRIKQEEPYGCAPETEWGVVRSMA